MLRKRLFWIVLITLALIAGGGSYLFYNSGYLQAQEPVETETITTYDKIEQVYYAEKKAVESGFADWNIRFIGHFSHWFHWGVMLYSRFIIEEPPQDAQEAVPVTIASLKPVQQLVRGILPADAGGLVGR